MKTRLFVILIGIFSINLFAQNSLYIPLNIQHAYTDSTRSMDGKPGENYWQNTSDYKIFASVNPKTRELKGTEVIIYHNNSPRELNQLVMRNYQDYYKKGVSRDYSINPKSLTDGVKINRLIINDEEIDLDTKETNIRRSGTLMFVPLPTPLAESKSVVLELSWSLIIPNKSLQRMGLMIPHLFSLHIGIRKFPYLTILTVGTVIHTADKLSFITIFQTTM